MSSATPEVWILEVGHDYEAGNIDGVWADKFDALNEFHKAAEALGDENPSVRADGASAYGKGKWVYLDRYKVQ
jgi:hypothetical protein